MRRYPHLYEINTHPFLRRVSGKYHRTLKLATVPEEEWQLLRRRGFDLVWLMGVWQRSPGARQQALHPSLHREYVQVLPDLAPEDVAGSPYAIYAYHLDSVLGEPDDLAQLKSRLNRQGLGLMLDFVPNHLALDHPWISSSPERFVQGEEGEVRLHPERFFSPGGKIHLAHGRDPYFAPWTDTVQVNFYSSDLRQALIDELRQIAEVADGVRCDMAMLALNDVFEQVWGTLIKGYSRPETEFWSEAITRVKQQRPDFLFLAEAYWGLEWKLQEIGFDFTYDKLLYDRLRAFTPGDVMGHLLADELYQRRSMRFIENHDELRAITAFGREPSLAAAVVLATVPGLRLFHDGQLEGRRLRLPVQLVRAPEEPIDAEVVRFYERLLTVVNTPAFHEGEWRLLPASQAGAGNESHHNLLAWCWRYADQLKVVVVNYSASPAQGYLKLPLALSSGGSFLFCDELAGETFTRGSSTLSEQGLSIKLAPWQAYILDVTPVRQ